MSKDLPAMQETLELWVQFLGQEDPWRRTQQPTPVFLLGESHGQRSLGPMVHRVTESRTWLKRSSTEEWPFLVVYPLMDGKAWGTGSWVSPSLHRAPLWGPLRA